MVVAQLEPARQKVIDQVVDAVWSVTGGGQSLLHRPFITEAERVSVLRAIESGAVGYESIEQFEGMLAERCRVKHVVAVSSGTAALHLSLLALGVKAGDSVCVPPLTFAAAAAAVCYTGAKPVFDSPLREYHARILVDLMGHPSRYIGPVDPRNTIEDAAEALGSKMMGRPCGSFTRIGILSFNNNKIVTTGGGGAVLTDDAGIAEHVRHLSTTAKVKNPFYFDHDAVGYNYRMPNICAALGIPQLARLDEILDYKWNTARRYSSAFVGIDGVSFVGKQSVRDEPNNWINMIRVPQDDRLPIMAALAGGNKQARALFTPLPYLPPYAGFDFDRDMLQAASEAFLTTVCLPSGFLPGTRR